MYLDNLNHQIEIEVMKAEGLGWDGQKRVGLMLKLVAWQSAEGFRRGCPISSYLIGTVTSRGSRSRANTCRPYAGCSLGLCNS